MNEFTDKVLPRFFKHNNYSSFVRQLNMYDFHKLRNSNNENIFQHKHFIRGQKALIKTIKRKSNAHRDSNLENQEADNDETNLVELCEKELNSKKISKSALEKVMAHMIKILNSTNEKQKHLELKVEMLGKQNEEFIMQNEQMIQELHTKNEYTKKLETLLFFILEVIIPKHTTFKNETKNALFSQNPINGLIPSTTNEFKTKTTNESTMNAINRANIMKTTTLDGGFLKDIMEKYFDHYNPNKREKLDLPMLTSSNEDYKLSKLYPYANNNELSTGLINQNCSNEYINYNIDSNNQNKNLQIKNNTLNQISLKNQQIKQEIPSDEKSNFFYSPNPFAIDDINFTHSNIFSSPKYNRNDNYLSFRNLPEEENKNNENNLINMNNTFNLSRNNSMDLNDFYKNGNNIDDDINKKAMEQNFAFDDSYFSVSSDKNKN